MHVLFKKGVVHIVDKTVIEGEKKTSCIRDSGTSRRSTRGEVLQATKWK